jgi:hypothetical protein
VSLPERLTIDVTVARDYLDEGRARHDRACELFALGRSGAVELAAATSGYIFDVAGDLEGQIREMLEDEGVNTTAQLAYPDVMFPAPNAFPGAGVEGLGEAWDAILANWRANEDRAAPGPTDRLHVETHVMEKRDVFITDDRPLLAMCRRLRDEHQIRVEAMSLAGYLDSRKG